MNKLYREIYVWKKASDNEAIRFVCFELIGENRFCVQSADYYREPLTVNKNNEFNKQQAELFLEDSPDVRSTTHASLEEAIAAFELDMD